MEITPVAAATRRSHTSPRARVMRSWARSMTSLSAMAAPVEMAAPIEDRAQTGAIAEAAVPPGVVRGVGGLDLAGACATLAADGDGVEVGSPAGRASRVVGHLRQMGVLG